MKLELAIMDEPFTNFKSVNDLKGFIFPVE